MELPYQAVSCRRTPDGLCVISSDELDLLYRDAATMAARLVFEDPSTMAPETREVMKRWRPRVLGGGES